VLPLSHHSTSTGQCLPRNSLVHVWHVLQPSLQCTAFPVRSLSFSVHISYFNPFFPAPTPIVSRNPHMLSLLCCANAGTNVCCLDTEFEWLSLLHFPSCRGHVPCFLLRPKIFQSENVEFTRHVTHATGGNSSEARTNKMQMCTELLIPLMSVPLIRNLTGKLKQFFEVGY
jgi:hypothetical protein